MVLTDFGYSILPATRRALAITRSHTYVWDYTTPNGASRSRVFDLPNPVRSTDPLPVGTLLVSGSSGEVGIVVITAAGKITFWENIETPEAFSLFQQKCYSAEGAVGGMLSGEKVSNMVSAEHAGFIVVFSTGRLAHLTLRDSQGRPRVSTQFLRNQANSESNGFLGGLKMVFGAGSWRADLVAVKTRPASTRNNVGVIAATLQGEFHVWEVDWSGQHEYKGVISAQTEITTALRSNDQTGARAPDSTKIVDFALCGKDQQTQQSSAEPGMVRGLNIMALVEQATRAGPSVFALAHITLSGSSIQVGRLIFCDYLIASSKQRGSQVLPKVYLPSPGHTAVIIFAFAIAIISMQEPEVTPESQLLVESHTQLPPYQDVIHIIKDEKARITGCCEEPSNGKTQEAELAVFVKQAGLLRLLVPENGPIRLPEEPRIQVENKIEQAVLYMDVPGTLINFHESTNAAFTLEQTEAAAMAISRKIVKSELDLIRTRSSMVAQLQERARLLRNLALCVRRVGSPLSRPVKWELLWDAEKIEAAQNVWSLFEERLAERGSGHRTNLEIAVSRMHWRRKTGPNPELGETDEMRNWFTRDTNQFHHIITCAFQAIRQDYERGNKDATSVLDMAREADEIALVTLETAFGFRSTNLTLYGLDRDGLKLTEPGTNSSDLPEIWTSSRSLIYALQKLIYYSRAVVLKCGTELVLPGGDDALSSRLERELLGVAARNPDLIRVTINSQEERVKWLAAQDDEHSRGRARDVEEEYRNWQRQQIVELQQIELWDDAIKLAREMNDMELLVEVIKEESEMHAPYLNLSRKDLEKNGLSKEDVREHEDRMSVLVAYIRGYFEKLGWQWAQPYYHSLIQRGTLGGFMEEAHAHEKFATRFLRKNEQVYAKLGWINEVLRKGKDKEAGRKDFARAGDMLTHWVRRSEKNLWSAKLEANVAKLAYMAQNDSGIIDSTQEQALAARFEAADSQSRLFLIQERVYAHVAPVLEKALDATAKIELTMAEFAQRVIRLGRKGQARTLQACLEKLLRLERLLPLELIELLTLIDVRKCELEENDISGQESGLALTVLKSVGLAGGETPEHGYLSLIWKRAMVKDDWKAVNTTQGKSDKEVNRLLGKTETCGAFKAIALLDPSARIRSISPEECHGAGVDSSKIQFPLADKRLAEQWASDNAADDEVLTSNLKHHRLGYWFERSKALALEELEQDVASKEKAKAQDLEEGLELLREAEGQSTNRKKINGHAPVNGVDEEVNGVEEEYKDDMALDTREDLVSNGAYDNVQEGQFFRNDSKRPPPESAGPEIGTGYSGAPLLDLTGEDDGEDGDDEEERGEDNYPIEEGDGGLFDDEENEEIEGDEGFYDEHEGGGDEETYDDEGDEEDGEEYEEQEYEENVEAEQGEDEDVVMEG